MRYVRIPKDRIGVLIGRNGKIKGEIERLTKVKLTIDSKTGEVQIDDSNVDDPLAPLKVENIVLAIGRGFSPEHAFRLLDDDTYFILIDLREYVGRKETHLRRVKGRIIGREGKTKRILEHMTDSLISVYGHTVAVITTVEFMETIRTALEMLIQGSKHGTVYKYLQKKRREIEMEMMF
ncbi:MAG: RNA-processing protein [Thermoplasmata archaeon]|nr:MAG: RNA-processing protein [Thermoplasmata archaeon]RLF52952.1 MAG: RNA-processing protein [Thermoplasmata archaeon]